MKLLTLLLAFSTFNGLHAKTLILTSSNTVVLNREFSSTSVAEVQSKLALLALNTKKDLYLVLDSPGGSVDAGLSLIDFAKALPNKVHTITLFSASMAYVTAQYLDRRYIVANGTMMSHRMRIGGLGGQVPGEADSRLSNINTMSFEISNIIAKRVGISYKEYMLSIYDELWLTGSQAVAKNHADEIVSARCDKTLTGSYESSVRTLFGEFTVVFSKCPLIRGPLDVKTDNKFIKLYIQKFFNFASRDFIRMGL
jgi:ATP-dependent Clp protease protease subunit